MKRTNMGVETDLEYNLKFFTQFIIHPTKTGAILPSNEKLCELMTDIADLNDVSAVVELGSGTGVITEKILRKKGPETKFFAMEINPTFVEATKRRCPEATVYQSSAENAGYHLELHGESGCDRVISSLPWSTFDYETQELILNSIYETLKPGGKFLTYAYSLGLLFPSAWRLRRLLKSKFDKVVKSSIVWSNIPPAFIYICEKAPAE
ncbi:MAG TPA: methyltransferase domain-containing protein [Thermodesulfobacteriota bacterium]|nr:methyltransferase domain-containing protein [Thermodesulfobacteriota bacterium]